MTVLGLVGMIVLAVVLYYLGWLCIVVGLAMDGGGASGNDNTVAGLGCGSMVFGFLCLVGVIYASVWAVITLIHAGVH